MSYAICKIHQRAIVTICLFKGCTKYLLCSTCIKEHPDDHEESSHDLCKIMEIATQYEQERDYLVSRERKLTEEKDSKLRRFKGDIECVKISVIESMEEKIKKLSIKYEEFVETNDKSDDVQTNYSALRADIQTLEAINFKPEADLEKVAQVKHFIDRQKPVTEDCIKHMNEILEKYDLEHSRIELYRDQVIKLLKSVELEDLQPAKSGTNAKEMTLSEYLMKEVESLREKLYGQDGRAKNQKKEREKEAKQYMDQIKALEDSMKAKDETTQKQIEVLEDKVKTKEKEREEAVKQYVDQLKALEDSMKVKDETTQKQIKDLENKVTAKEKEVQEQKKIVENETNAHKAAIEKLKEAENVKRENEEKIVSQETKINELNQIINELKNTAQTPAQIVIQESIPNQPQVPAEDPVPVAA